MGALHSFREIWGNERLLQHLRRAVKNKKISHAYLLVGGAGAGKRMIASAFAKYMLCDAGGEEPCGVCQSCRVFDSGNHPDVLWVTSEKKTLGVDEIRSQILDTVGIKPYHYDKKIYILPQAHTMTVQAQNALLKTLEEPPEYAVFLLLAEREEAFLPTVLSRAVVLKISPLREDEIRRYLTEKQLASPEQAAVFAAYAQGRIGQALALLEDEAFQQMRESLLQSMSRLPAMGLAEALLLAKEWEQYKNVPDFLDILGLWYRDLLVAKCLRDEKYLIQKDKKEMILAGAGEPAALIAKKAAAVAKGRERLAQNANFRLTLEVMLMELKENRV